MQNEVPQDEVLQAEKLLPDELLLELQHLLCTASDLLCTASDLLLPGADLLRPDAVLLCSDRDGNRSAAARDDPGTGSRCLVLT